MENHDLFCFFSGKTINDSTHLSKGSVWPRKYGALGLSTYIAIGADVHSVTGHALHVHSALTTLILERLNQWNKTWINVHSQSELTAPDLLL